MEAARTHQQPAAASPHRPQHQFTPPANWMDVPNGMIKWHEQYHLFYQYNSYSQGMIEYARIFAILAANDLQD